MRCCSAPGRSLFKGIFIPWLLLRAIREVRIRREVEPFIGFVPTLILGALVTAGAFIFADFLPLAPEHRRTACSCRPRWPPCSAAFCC